MKTGQAWLGAIAFAMAMAGALGIAQAQDSDPGAAADGGNIPEVSADAQISR